MRSLCVFIADLGTDITIKDLEASEIELFVQEYGDLPKPEYVKRVLESIIFNMKTEIRESLRMMSRDAAKMMLDVLYNAAITINPGIDIDRWTELVFSISVDETPTTQDEPIQNILFPEGNEELPSETVVSSAKRIKAKRITKAKFLNLERYLRDRVIGQDEAISAVVNALKRSQVGLNDEGRPLGVFLFSGSSGVGKTHFARELHKYLYGDEKDIVRIDCGEYQHKHDNQKLIGAPPGYIGHENGGQLADAVRNNPDTVVLLDEVEKAHADIWNTFLRVFDEGILTDSKGRRVDFRNTVIIMTTNLGNDKVVEHLTAGGVGFNTRLGAAMSTKKVPAREHVERVVHDSVKKLFKPEFLNRIDQTIVFNYLDFDNYIKIAELEVSKIEDKLSKRGIVLKWDERVLDLLVELGVDSVRGARGMTQVRRDHIENVLADKMIMSRIVRGTIIELSVNKGEFQFAIIAPKKKTTDEE